MSDNTPTVPPLPPLVALSFDLRPRTEHDPASDHATVMQINFQRQGEALTSFDAEQLPGVAKQIMGEVAVNQATTLTNQAAMIAQAQSDIQAKDGNIQKLLGQVADLQAAAEHDKAVAAKALEDLAAEKDAEIARLRAVVDAFHAETHPEETTVPVEPQTVVTQEQPPS